VVASADNNVLEAFSGPNAQSACGDLARSGFTQLSTQDGLDKIKSATKVCFGTNKQGSRFDFYDTYGAPSGSALPACNETGLAYPATPNPNAPKPTPASPAPTEVPSSTPGASGTSVTTVTEVVHPGGSESIHATTAPNARCNLTVHYKTGPGTSTSVADDKGEVSWTFSLTSRATLGTYPFDIDCSPGGSASGKFSVG
jgi:hypothetical protein